jgi:hypothetical protein
MALSDCEKCWDTPCTCGWDYRRRSEQYRLQLATAAAPLGYAVVKTGWQPPGILRFSGGMTVADLKRVIADWPEINHDGTPCEVWIGDGDGHSSQARNLSPLTIRTNEDGRDLADVLIDRDA